jgi:hypothetical protein
VRDTWITLKVLMGNPQRNRPLKRPKWEDNIKMDLVSVVSSVMDWIYVHQDRDYWGALVKTVMNSGVL